MEIFNIEDGEAKNVTKEVELYSFLLAMQQMTKKDRPDLVPDKKTWIVGMGKTAQTAIKDCVDKIAVLMNSNHNLKATKETLQSLVTEKWIQFGNKQQQGKYFCAIQFLKVTL